MKKLSIIFMFFLIVTCGEKTEQVQQTEQTQDPHSTQNPHKVTGALTWNAPEGWIQETPSSRMRKAQYRLPRAEGDPEDASVAIFHFPGGGSVDANLRRWYGQFVQPDGKSSEEVAKVSKSTINNLNQTVVDLSGTYLFKPTPMAPTSTEKPGFRMLAAVIETSSGPWFVKAVGPEKTMAQWEDSFYEFMKSFKE